MILARFRRALRRQDWFAVCLEVLIVIVGVLLALAASDWSEGRRARETEAQSLRELRTALANDLEDVRLNARVHARNAASARILQTHLAAGGPYHDSLDAHFGNLNSFTFSVRDLAPYETLKQRGMETVTDDQLRLAIGKLYGVEYERVMGLQAATQDFVLRDLGPFSIDHFRDHRLSGSATPIDYAFVAASPRMRSLVDLSTEIQGMMARYLAGLEEQMAALIASLDAEIARLE